MKYKTNYKSVVGTLTLISDGQNLTHIIFEKEPYYQSVKKEAQINNDLKIFKQTKNWLDKYFNKENPSISELPLDLQGTKFQIKVWNILKTIPYGQTITYGKIAKKINPNMSSRAVGRANAYNPIPIIIPCHRVVGTNNNLTGYSGGLDIKIKLLQLENIDITKYKLPKT